MLPEQDDQIIQSIRLAMRILESLASTGGEKGVTELAKELSVTKARAFRHVQTLRKLGYITHSKTTKKDRVGMHLHLLAKMVGDNVELSRSVSPALEMLRDNTEQTAVFSTVLEGKMTLIDLKLGTTQVQYTFRPGATFNLNSSSIGHISLAFGPQEYWEYVEAERFEQETPKTITDPAKLAIRVEIAKSRGWTIVTEEANLGVNAIAAPVFYHDGTYAGAIAIVGSVQNIHENPTQNLIDAVVSAGKQASRNLGWRPENKK